jgi:hypothetical protein
MTDQLMVCVNDVNLLGKNTSIIKKNSKAPLDAGKVKVIAIIILMKAVRMS